MGKRESNEEKTLPNLEIEPKIPKKKRPKLARIITWSIIGLGLLIFIVVSVSIERTDLLKTVFYDGIVNNILAVPSILIGLITLLGYLLLRKKWYDAIGGGIKAIIGYLILQSGSFILTGISKPLMQTLGSLFGSSFILLDPYAGWSDANNVLGQAATIVSYAVLIGLATNIVLVALKKITNVHSINVTGHIMFQQTACLIAVLYFLVFKNIDNEDTRQIVTLTTGGILIGLYWGVFSNLTIAPTNALTNNANFAIGHQQMLVVWASYQSGKLFQRKGKKFRSAEDMKLPESLKIFHDNIFTSSILMLLFFGILFIVLHSVNIEAWNEMIKGLGGLNFFGDKFWFLQVVGLSLEIVASLQILMMGARMFVVELQKSFIGISNKLIPGAVVAIDIAGSFAFGEKAVVYGFLAGALGNFIGMGIIILLGQVLHLDAFNVVIMVGFIAMFFDNAAAGLYANIHGGWVGCITVAFLAGLITTFGAVLAIQTSGIWTSGYNGMWDWTTIWGIFFALFKISGTAAPYMLILIAIIFLIIAQLTTVEPKKEMPIKRQINKMFSLTNKNQKKEELKVQEE